MNNQKLQTYEVIARLYTKSNFVKKCEFTITTLNFNIAWEQLGKTLSSNLNYYMDILRIEAKVPNLTHNSIYQFVCVTMYRDEFIDDSLDMMTFSSTKTYTVKSIEMLIQHYWNDYKEENNIC